MKIVYSRWGTSLLPQKVYLVVPAKNKFGMSMKYHRENEKKELTLTRYIA
jgi:hypothetical protein